MIFGKKLKKTIKIEGMHCNHCVMKVEGALNALEGIISTKVNLDKKEAVVTLEQDVSNEVIKKAIAELDFEVTEIF